MKRWNTKLLFSLIAVSWLILAGSNSAKASDFNFIVETEGRIYNVSDSLVNVMVNNEILATNEMPGIAFEQRTLVPLREIFEMKGIEAQVEWNNKEKSITITRDNRIIRLQIGSTVAFVDGLPVIMDSYPRLVRDVNKTHAKTMIPIRFVAETLGYDVEWNSKSKLAKLSYTADSLLNNPIDWTNKEYTQDDVQSVNNMQLIETGGETKLLIRATWSMKFSTLNLENPKRFVIDVKDAVTDLGSRETAANGSLVSGVRTAPYNNNTVRFVLDLKKDVDIKVEENENILLITITHKAIETPTVRKPVVVIDAGHGNTDPGAVSYGIREKDINLSMLLALKSRFDRRDDIIVYYTRTDDTYPTLKQRADLANAVNADLVLSIHNNSVWDKNVSGTETLYKPGTGSYNFAYNCQKYLISDLGLKNRGLVKRDNLYVLNHAKAPVALVEVGFVSNVGDVAKLTDYNFVQKTAIALEKAINETLGLNK